MKINLLFTGKTTNSSIRALEADYCKRLGYYTSLEITTIDNTSIRGNNETELCLKEGELILKKVKPADHLLLLDEKGKSYSSMEFASELNRWMNASLKSIVLVIGGPYGFSEAVRKRSNASISLSPMTFSHQMVRIILLEQLYRAFTILHNEPYHHS